MTTGTLPGSPVRRAWPIGLAALLAFGLWSSAPPGQTARAASPRGPSGPSGAGPAGAAQAPVQAPRDSVYLPWLANSGGSGAGLEPRLPFLPRDDIDVRHYDVRLEVELDDGAEAPIEVRAAVTVTVVARTVIAYVDLDVEPRLVDVEAVTDAGGAPLGHALIPGVPTADGLVTGTRLRVLLDRPLAAGAATEVRIEYGIGLSAADAGFRYISTEGQRFLQTHSWPYYTRLWLPSHDHPSDDATATFELHVPPDMVAVANGRLDGGDYTAGSGLDGRGLRVFRWVQDVPLATYLFHIAVGDLDVEHEEICFDVVPAPGSRAACETAEHAVPLVVYYRKLTSPEARAPFRTQILKSAEAMVYYAAVLGPYPYAKLGFIVGPHPFNMEYASAIALTSSEAAVHEVLHSWWGDSVRIGHWGDFWISEGFTTYFTGYFDEAHGGANSAALCPTATARLGHPPDTDPNAIFDLTPYCKGAWAIEVLRGRMAAAAAMAPADPRAVGIFLGLMDELYDAYAGRQLGRIELAAFLRAGLAPRYASEGLAVDQAGVDALVDAWIAEAFAYEASRVRAAWPDGSANYPAEEGIGWRPQLADIGPVSGEVAWYGLACKDDEGQPSAPVQDVAGRIALVERGACVIYDKVKAAEGHGARAVLVFSDDRPRSAMGCGPPSDCATGAGIPALMVDRAPGLGLRVLVEAGTLVSVTLETRRLNGFGPAALR